MVVIDTGLLGITPNNFTGKTYNQTYKTFKKNNMVHRYYGPARIWDNGNKSWWFNNKYYGDYNYHYKYSQKQFIKALRTLWLL